MTSTPTSAKPVGKGVAHILEIGPYPPPFGGWSQRIALLQGAITDRGHRCIVLNIGAGRRVPSSEYECVRSIPEYVFKLVRFARRRFLFHLHVNGSSHLRIAIAIVAAMITLGFGRRPVVTFHAGQQQVFFPRQRSAAMMPALWFLFRVSRWIICNNEDVRQRIAEYGIGAAKIVAIPAFSRQYLAAADVEPSAQIGAFFGGYALRALVYTDREGSAAVLDILMRAHTEWPDLRTVVVSADCDDVRRGMQAYRALADRVLVLSPRAHSEFLALLPKVCVYLRCRGWDGDSASVREALALGTPVVANDTGSRPSSVRIYAEGDRAAMWQALASVLRDPAAARREVERPPLDDTLEREVEILVGAS